MARLPDRTALGERDPRSVRGVPNYPLNDPVVDAMGNMGRALQGAGADLMRFGAEQRQVNDQLELARARSGFNADAIRLRSELNEDQDYEMLTPRVEQRLTQAREEHARRIRDPRLRERFMLESEDDVQRNRAWAVDRSRVLERDRGLASFQERSLEGQRLFYEAQSDEERGRLVSGFGAEVDAMVGKGWISAQDAQRIKTDWQAGAALTYIQSLPPGQRAAILQADGSGEAALIQRESSGNPAAVNQFGFAGLYQFGAPRLVDLGVYTRGAGEDLGGWNRSRRDAPGKWSGTFNIPGFEGVRTLQDFLANPEAQQAVYRMHVQRMDREAANLGLDQFIGQEVGGVVITRDGLRNMIHLGGPGGARDFLRSGGQTNRADANGTSMADYARMGAPGGAEYVRYLTPQQRAAEMNRARTELAQQAAQAERAAETERRAYVSHIDDYTAFLRNGGAPRSEFTPNAVTAVLGEEAAAPVIREIQRAEAYGADVRAVAFASPQEVAGIVAEREAALQSPEGFRANMQDMAGLQSVIARRETALRQDPAGYTLQDETVRGAYQRLFEGGTPADVAAYAAATLSLQEKLGVAAMNRRLLSEAAADEIAAQFKFQPEGGQNAAQMMQSLAAQWGKHWPQVFSELAQGNRLPDVVKVIGTMNRVDQQRAAEALAEAAVIGRQALERTFEGTVKNETIREINRAFEPFAATLAHSPTGAGTANAFAEAGHLLALSYMRQGDSPSRAAARAFEDIVGRRYHPISGSFRVPVDHDLGAVETGARAAIVALPDVPFDVPRSLFGLPDDIARDQYLSALAESGFWVTAPGDAGLMLYQADGFGGSAVTVDGQPFVLSWDELTRRGADIAAPLTPQARSARQGGFVAPPVVDPGLDAMRREIDDDASSMADEALVERGNIDLTTRPIVENSDGSVSTVETISFGTDEGEVLVPLISDAGRRLTEDEAIAEYERTGRHLGIFSSIEAAERYARQLSNDQADMVRRRRAAPPIVDADLDRWRRSLDEGD